LSFFVDRLAAIAIVQGLRGVRTSAVVDELPARELGGNLDGGDVVVAVICQTVEQRRGLLLDDRIAVLPCSGLGDAERCIAQLGYRAALDLATIDRNLRPMLGSVVWRDA